MPRTVIIGAGIAGLATAGLLAREGHEVTVLERGHRPGGRAGLIEDAGFRFDTGPSWYLMPEVFDHFFAMMGTSTAAELDLHDLSPAYRLLCEPVSGADAAQVVDVESGPDQTRALFESLEPGSGPRIQRYLDSARSTYEMALQRFLYNPFTNPATLATPAVTAQLPRLVKLLTEPLERFVNRRFSHTALRQILQYPAVFLATHPQSAPSMYHLMSHMDLADGVRYPMGGFTRVVEVIGDLAQRSGAEIRYGAEVTGITTETLGRRSRWRRLRGGIGSGLRRRSRATGVTWTDEHGVQHEQACDYVVSAADLHHTETQLLTEADRSYSQDWWEKKVVSGPGAVLVMLGVRGSLPQLAHHSLVFASDWSGQFRAIFGSGELEGPLSIYVCRPSATDPSVAPEGSENLFMLVPVPADTKIGAGGAGGAGDPEVERIADEAVDQVAAWTGVEDLRQRITVRHTLGPADFSRAYHSWSGGALGPAHTVGQSAMFRPQNASPRVEGLYYAGATVAPGVGVPMCLISAELVLKRIRGDRSPGPSRAPKISPAAESR